MPMYVLIRNPRAELFADSTSRQPVTLQSDNVGPSESLDRSECSCAVRDAAGLHHFGTVFLIVPKHPSTVSKGME